MRHKLWHVHLSMQLFHYHCSFMIHHIAPYFGYFASLCLIVALLVKTAIQFRVFNILGCVSFIIYAVIFSTWPVLITNGILLVINVFYLNKISKHKEDFDLIEFTSAEKLAQKFLLHNKADIDNYFPAFDAALLMDNLNFIVTRDLVIANVFSVQLHTNGDAIVELNYTSKKYRDFKIGKFIFEKAKQMLLAKGIRRIIYKTVFNKSHETFLKVSGFTKDGEGYFKIIQS